jgi:hypothetical protein
VTSARASLARAGAQVPLQRKVLDNSPRPPIDTETVSPESRNFGGSKPMPELNSQNEMTMEWPLL